jgi:hypothetical protein
MEVCAMPEGQFAWATHAPADYLLVFVPDPGGEHAVVRARFPDGGDARDAGAGLEGAELAGAELRVYCTLPDEIERVLSRLSNDSRADVSKERGTVEFVAVGEGAARPAERGGATSVRLVVARGGDAPRCYRFTEQCPRCGEFHGKVNVLPRGGVMIDTRELRCRCQGIACRYCQTGVIRRPLSDHFDPERRAGHAPWFGYLVPCGGCQAAGRGPRVIMSLGRETNSG